MTKTQQTHIVCGQVLQVRVWVSLTPVTPVYAVDTAFRQVNRGASKWTHSLKSVSSCRTRIKREVNDFGCTPCLFKSTWRHWEASEADI